MESWRQELYHYGIKGQHWGIKRGPPYPIGEAGKSNRKVAGKIDNPVEKSYAKQRKFSKAAKTGAVIAVAGLAAYGAYKTGAFKHVHDLGKRAVREALNQIGSVPVSGVSGSPSSSNHGNPKQSTPKPKGTPVIRDPKTGFKLINEPLSETLKNTNPLKGTPNGDNNCTYCAVAGFLRSQGYDVTAKSTSGKAQNLGGVLENCFKGVKVYEGSAIKFAKSPEDAAQMLKKRFGDNASGAVGIDWKGGADGHAFSWVIKDGVVQFFDFQNNRDNQSVTSVFWHYIDPNGNLTFARLDGLEIKLDNIDHYVDGR